MLSAPVKESCILLRYSIFAKLCTDLDLRESTVSLNRLELCKWLYGVLHLVFTIFEMLAQNGHLLAEQLTVTIN